MNNKMSSLTYDTIKNTFIEYLAGIAEIDSPGFIKIKPHIIFTSVNFINGLKRYDVFASSGLLHHCWYDEFSNGWDVGVWY